MNPPTSPVSVPTATLMPCVLPPTGPRILVVDDDTDDRSFIQQAFAGCAQPSELFIATDGVDCLRFLGAMIWLPDLILLDINMPRMNGFEVLQHFRALPKWHNLVVVILSIDFSIQTQELARQLGATGCLAKPEHYSGYESLVEQLFALHF